MSGARETPLSVFVAIFLLSFAALLFQFVQTRLFSTMLDYHLTFLVVSGALLGVAGGGAAAAVVDVRASSLNHHPRVTAFSIVALVAFAATLFLTVLILWPRELQFEVDGPKIYEGNFPYREDPEEVYRRSAYWIEALRLSNREALSRTSTGGSRMRATRANR